MDLEGIEKVEALKGRLFIPYSHVRSIDDSADGLIATLRLGGTSLGPGGLHYGRFETSEGYGFLAFREKDRAFVVHLSDDRYSVLALEPEDRDGALAGLRSRLRDSAGAQ